MSHPVTIPHDLIAGTAIVVHHHSSAGAGTVSTAVSGELPYPSVIVQLSYSTNSAGGDSPQARFDAYLSPDASTSTTNITGTKLATLTLAGATRPDFNGDTSEAFPHFGSAGETQRRPMDVWIVVPDNGYRLKTFQRQITATVTVTSWVIVCLLLRRPIETPEVAILPRGEVAPQPCIPVCPPGPPGPPPPPPPPGGGPTPPQPKVSVIRAEPLPAPCTVDPAYPLKETLDACAVP